MTKISIACGWFSFQNVRTCFENLITFSSCLGTEIQLILAACIQNALFAVNKFEVNNCFKENSNILQETSWTYQMVCFDQLLNFGIKCVNFRLHTFISLINSSQQAGNFISGKSEIVNSIPFSINLIIKLRCKFFYCFWVL